MVALSGLLSGALARTGPTVVRLVSKHAVQHVMLLLHIIMCCIADIIEAINVMPNNQMALHTTEGCTHNTPPDQLGYSGELDCGTGSGCTVGESKQNSYESGFAAAGGGVFATQFDVAGIK